MSDRDDALVKPAVTKNTPRLGRLAVLISSESDMRLLDRRMGIDPADYRPLFMSRLYPDPSGQAGFSIAGPIVGAPYAVMVLENLIAWGVRRCIFVGWCGAISADVKIGDIVLPNAAIIDEGTSRHYSGGWEASALGRAVATGTDIIYPSPAAVEKSRAAFRGSGISVHEGTVWSTDAIYRETAEKMAHYKGRGAIAVEMEVSALLTAAAFRGIDVAAVLIVSDALSASSWKPGFRDPRFKTGRERAMQGIEALRDSLEPSGALN